MPMQGLGAAGNRDYVGHTKQYGLIEKNDNEVKLVVTVFIVTKIL